ncbi:hypothetical protein [uncultured Bacteroides sp.]|uniref:hypothetical protein n=1 Tax=uncultured Bacteroides sp. TaxID=162156 RepID=UPI002AAC3BC4|nr:hypothetical protein [uncultured Bacteroides sp.]
MEKLKWVQKFEDITNNENFDFSDVNEMGEIAFREGKEDERKNHATKSVLEYILDLHDVVYLTKQEKVSALLRIRDQANLVLRQVGFIDI